MHKSFVAPAKFCLQMTPTLKPVSVFKNLFRTFLVNFANVSGLIVVTPVYRTFNSSRSSSAFEIKDGDFTKYEMYNTPTLQARFRIICG